MAKYIIKYPMGIPPWEADNWRAIDAALREMTITTNKVDSPVDGLSVIKGKVRVDKNDTTPEFLENKIVESNTTTFVQTSDGLGAKEIKVHSKVIEATSEPSDMIAGELLFDTDARFGTPFEIGDGEADIDYELLFKGETNEGSFTWMEDEDYLLCADDLLMSSTENVYFRDTAISINSADDGHLDLTADTSIDLNGVTLATDKIAFTQTDLNEYIDSLADGYIDYRATTGHRFGDGTNYTMLAADGHQTMVGTAKPWEDLRIEPVARTTGANAPTFEQWWDDSGLGDTGTSRGIYLYSFDDAVGGSEKEIFFSMQMPHQWDGGEIHLHIHWVGAVADTTAAPRWGLEYNMAEIGVTYAAPTIVYTDGSNYSASGTEADIVAGRHYISKFSAITPGATQDGLSSVLIGRLFRDSADAGDTYNAVGAKCGLLYVDAHYQINSIGSTDEYAK